MPSCIKTGLRELSDNYCIFHAQGQQRTVSELHTETLFRPFYCLFVYQLVNLLTNDGQRLAETIIYMAVLFATPYLLVVASVVSCLIIGWTGVLGVLTFLLFVPVQVRRKILVAVAARNVLTLGRQLEQIFDKRVLQFLSGFSFNKKY